VFSLTTIQTFNFPSGQPATFSLLSQPIFKRRLVEQIFTLSRHSLSPHMKWEIFSFIRMLQKAAETNYININCVDPLGRSALLMAIDNENLEMVELLINHRVDTKDALLHAISEEFVEAVEVLLDHEDCSHRDGDPHVSKSKLWRVLECRPNE
jgi:hypothetical protein